MVLYNVTSKIYELNATPFEIWVLAGILGVILFLLSLRPSEDKGDIGRSIVISVMAWVPIAFTALTSFAVDKMTAIALTSDDGTLMETHTIYSYDLIGYIFGAFLLVAIANTLRLVMLQSAFRESDNLTTRSEEYEPDY